MSGVEPSGGNSLQRALGGAFAVLTINFENEIDARERVLMRQARETRAGQVFGEYGANHGHALAAPSRAAVQVAVHRRRFKVLQRFEMEVVGKPPRQAGTDTG